MALLKALAAGAIAAISLPYVLRDETGLLKRAVYYATIQPDAGTFAFVVSIPIFLLVTLFAWVMFRLSDT